MRLLLVLSVIYVIICVLLFFLQERLLFFPDKKYKDAPYRFDQNFEELNFITGDEVTLNGVLFKCDLPKGLIFYLHGNGGSIESWGEIAGAYTRAQYDLFILDYRGYGKSGGRITSEKQLHEDVQFVFDQVKGRYHERDVIVAGYSLGTALAAKLAAENSVKRVILQAPYYSMTDVMKDHYPVIPTFILRYKLETYKYIKKCTMPITIFHGDQDKLINYSSSVKLKEFLKPKDTLIILEGQGHNEMSDHPEFTEALKSML